MAGTCVAIGLGSNVGDSRTIIEDAGRRLARLGPLRLSRIYTSAPLHLPDQPDYLNRVALVTTSFAPSEILRYLKTIENEWGRDRTRERRFGARPLDLDLLLWGRIVLQGSHLTIPHPRMTGRAFVLLPLLELDPGGRNPATNNPWRDYLPGVKDQFLKPLPP